MNGDGLGAWQKDAVRKGEADDPAGDRNRSQIERLFPANQ
jgi:hypothetical protein